MKQYVESYCHFQRNNPCIFDVLYRLWLFLIKFRIKYHRIILKSFAAIGFQKQSADRCLVDFTLVRQSLFIMTFIIPHCKMRRQIFDVFNMFWRCSSIVDGMRMLSPTMKFRHLLSDWLNQRQEYPCSLYSRGWFSWSWRRLDENNSLKPFLYQAL